MKPAPSGSFALGSVGNAGHGVVDFDRSGMPPYCVTTLARFRTRFDAACFARLTFSSGRCWARSSSCCCLRMRGRRKSALLFGFATSRRCTWSR